MPDAALITSRDPKGLQFGKVVDAVYDGARLEEGEAQNVNEQGDEIKRVLGALIERLRKPRPEVELIQDQYQQERGSLDFEFQLEPLKTCHISRYMKEKVLDYLLDTESLRELYAHEGHLEIVCTEIWTPEVRAKRGTAEPVFIGFMVNFCGFQAYTAIITDIKKIDEGMDCEVLFNIKVTVSEFAC